MFPGKTAFAERKGCKLQKKQKFTKTSGMCFNMCFDHPFCFLGVVVLFFGKSPKRLFTNSRGLPFLPPKTLSSKSFFSFFSSSFSFVFPFKIPSLFFLFLHVPVFRKHPSYFCSIVLWILPFPFVVIFLLSFKQTSLTSPFPIQIVFIFGDVNHHHFKHCVPDFWCSLPQFSTNFLICVSCSAVRTPSQW